MAGGSAVAAVRAVAVEDGPGLTAPASVLTATGRAPEGETTRGEGYRACAKVYGGFPSSPRQRSDRHVRGSDGRPG